MKEKGPTGDEHVDPMDHTARKNRRDTLLLAIALAALAGLALLAVKFLNPGYSREPYRRTEFVLDDYVTVTAYGKDQALVEGAVDAAFRELFRIQGVADRYDEASELARVNAEAASHPVAVSEDLWRMIETGVELYRSSGGAFDITVGPLVDLWDVLGRGEKGDPPPAPEEVAAVMERVGTDKLILDPAARTVAFAREGMKIDVGGLAKGYALDLAADTLRSRGIQAGYVSMISTDITLGEKPSAAGGPLWRVAVIDPRGEDYLATLLLTGGKYVSTSGDYQRFFEYGGVRYHHILDPRTGYPARGAISVTVVGGRDGAWSYGMATAAFVMGYPEGLEWINGLGVEAIFADPEGAIHFTPGMEKWIEEIKERAG